MSGQRKMTEIVGPELKFDAVHGLSARWGRHDGGVVDENIQARLSASDPLSKLENGFEIGKIDPLEIHARRRHEVANLVDSFRSALGVTARNRNVGSLARQFERVLKAKSACARNNGAPASQRGVPC